MNRYIVYRHGWDKRNQTPDKGLPEKMAVARIEASSPEEACHIAESQVTLSAGQYLTAEDAEAIDARTSNLNLKAEALPHPPGTS